MQIAIFDTLMYAKKLQEAGFTQVQAEVQAEALKDVIENNLATKQDILDIRRDLHDLKINLTRELKILRNDSERTAETLTYKLTLRLGTMLVVGISVLAAIMKL